MIFFFYLASDTAMSNGQPIQFDGISETESDVSSLDPLDAILEHYSIAVRNFAKVVKLKKR